MDFTLSQGTVFEEKSLPSGEHAVGLYYVFVIVSDLVSSGTGCGHSCMNLPCMELQQPIRAWRNPGIIMTMCKSHRLAMRSCLNALSVSLSLCLSWMYPFNKNVVRKTFMVNNIDQGGREKRRFAASPKTSLCSSLAVQLLQEWLCDSSANCICAKFSPCDKESFWLGEYFFKTLKTYPACQEALAAPLSVSLSICLSPGNKCSISYVRLVNQKELWEVI